MMTSHTTTIAITVNVVVHHTGGETTAVELAAIARQNIADAIDNCQFIEDEPVFVDPVEVTISNIVTYYNK